MTTEIEKGDWISFVRDCRITIGQVEYMPERKSWEREGRIVTTAGEITPEYILEVRKQSK